MVNLHDRVGELLEEKPQSRISTRVVESSGRPNRVGICFQEAVSARPLTT
jgi:hypothetical protein